MANIILNPGAGGPPVATDVHGGDNYQLVKIAGNRAGLFPGYSGPADTFPAALLVDDDGSLMTRAAVLTDEGTFRCNFANTSLFISIGSVTVSGAVVTGTGFLAADVHRGDYFKIAADADTLCQQIESIDSDTQLTLKANYTGSTSGTGQRAIMLPVTGAGGSNAVASGQLTITAGTTATSQTGVKRFLDYGPLVYRARGNCSQRIANQALRAGLREDATTPRWFSWFLLDGTVATTVKCQTARNPTGAPSAAETQETTITLPNGATTATARDWRIELLTESVRFYVDRVLVAEHTVTIPHQHDEMAAVYEFVNGTTPASGTTAVVDYVTGKNHNKVEIGVMSDAEQILAANAPAEMRTFSQAGVITVNTDLFIIDCAQLQTISLTVSSLGTSGVLTPFWTNDLSVTGSAGVFCQTTPGSAGLPGTINSAQTVLVPKFARYLRIRLTTATTAGTTTLTVAGFQQVFGPPVNASLAQASVTIAGINAGLTASTARVGNVSGAGIWYDDSSTVLAANATFTGTNRDATVTATATAFANAATYAEEIRVSAESDQSGTLWIEVSRDNTNWRRAKSVPTAAVTGGGQYAEIIHRPSWRYWRVGFTNGATLQARFSIGSIATA